MRKIYTLVFLISMSLTASYAQSLGFYYPDGKKYLGQAKNIAQLNKELEDHGRVYRVAPLADDGDVVTSVGYKLFTSTPLWVMTDDPKKVPKALEKFDLDEFLTSWKMETELEAHIKKGTLSDIFILETLGGPNSRQKYFDANIEFERWTYNNLDLMLTFKKGIVVSYIRL